MWAWVAKIQTRRFEVVVHGERRDLRRFVVVILMDGVLWSEEEKWDDLGLVRTDSSGYSNCDLISFLIRHPVVVT